MFSVSSKMAKPLAVLILGLYDIGPFTVKSKVSSQPVVIFVILSVPNDPVEPGSRVSIS